MTAMFGCYGKGGCPDENTGEVRSLVAAYPDVQVLIARRWSVSDEETALLAQFPQLHTLCVNEISLTETGLRRMRDMVKLKTLVGFASDQQAIDLRTGLPGCQVHTRPLIQQ